MMSCFRAAAMVATNTGGAARAQAINWKAVEAAMERSGAEQAGGVYRFSLAGGELQVTAPACASARRSR